MNTINRQLFDLLRRIEEGARRLASTPVRDIALAEFKREVAGGASVGEMRGRLTKE